MDDARIALIATVLAWCEGCSPDEVKDAQHSSWWMDEAQQCSEELEMFLAMDDVVVSS